MRTSSTNIILLAIAISNLVYLVFPIMEWMKRLYNTTQTCPLPDSYAFVVFHLVYYCVQDDVRRCDFFLGLVMALIRAFVLKYPMKSRTATSVSFGWKNCLIALLSSSIISSGRFLNIQVTPVEYLQLKCKWGFLNKPHIVYSILPSELGMWNHSLLTRIHVILDAIFSKIFPPVLFPIVAFLLIVQLHKIEESRNKIFSDSNQNKNSGTTKLIFLNTIAYVVSTLPGGIVHILDMFYTEWADKVSKESSGTTVTARNAVPLAVH
ncbi:unnamed protein product [Caenorhabditis nigoni]